MPRLAQRLDVGVTSIYWYFRSKEELLDTMTERAMGEYDRSFDLSQDLPWDEYVRTYFRQFRQVFRSNGLLCDLIVMRSGPLTPEATRIAAQRIDLVLDVLVRAGFSPDTSLYAYSTLSVFARGHLFLERSWTGSGRPEKATEPFRDTPGLTVLAHLDQPHTMSMVSDEDFEFGLENTIRGLRFLLDEQSEEPYVAPRTELRRTPSPPSDERQNRRRLRAPAVLSSPALRRRSAGRPPAACAAPCRSGCAAARGGSRRRRVSSTHAAAPGRTRAGRRPWRSNRS